MSIIEKAVKRLDQLKSAAGEGVVESAPLPEALVLPEDKPLAPKVESNAPVVATPAPVRAQPKSVHIDLARLAARGLVTPDQPRSAIAEEFRLIKRPLLANAVLEGPAAVDNGNLIMISSALPGEGKTFNAINLAISMAMELDYTVLLVDADVSRPSVLREFDLPPQPGLMDVLAGEVEDLSEVLLKTNIDKLSILPAGMPHQRATELLASDGMTQLLEQMAHRYADRIIVFDSPPLLVTTESRVLATHMGQVVLVVEAERTTHAHVRQALAAIEPCPIRMMVLNKSRDRSVGGYYGYGYGYGYGKAPEASSEAA
ncbi:XrtA-associated tyrosine autokinase [Thauera aminoaromatica]|uniref:XrtA-associated tyrosine autokinase n=1 Tax=Thauera aminoaromatica TaxID=164330 RepID=UPI0023568E9D|nr:XrtA-associated tyrosine autokinase [Thauera aminoaromatica]MCK6397347.1 XrtA-associated tyrosine autokinase [Thauera aminoaromatica]